MIIPDQIPEVLSVGDAADILGLSERNLRQWITKGYVPCHRIGTSGRSKVFTSEQVRTIATELDRGGRLSITRGALA